MGALTIIGWLIVAGYFVACISCWRLGRKIEAKDDNALRERRIWLIISILLLALGISRLLDLETALAEGGRSIAFSEGWYGRRKVFQLALIDGVSITCLAIVTTLVIWARRTPFPTWLGITAAILVIGYILIRAASLHQIDVFIEQRIFLFRWNWIFEMGGTGLVILASMWRARRIAIRSQ
jgi:hypothetical protein